MPGGGLVARLGSAESCPLDGGRVAPLSWVCSSLSPLLQLCSLEARKGAQVGASCLGATPGLPKGCFRGVERLANPMGRAAAWVQCKSVALDFPSLEGTQSLDPLGRVPETLEEPTP